MNARISGNDFVSDVRTIIRGADYYPHYSKRDWDRVHEDIRRSIFYLEQDGTNLGNLSEKELDKIDAVLYKTSAHVNTKLSEYLRGLIKEKRAAFEVARKYYATAAANGNINACMKLIEFCMKQKQFESAYQWFLMANDLAEGKLVRLAMSVQNRLLLADLIARRPECVPEYKENVNANAVHALIISCKAYYQAVKEQKEDLQTDALEDIQGRLTVYLNRKTNDTEKEIMGLSTHRPENLYFDCIIQFVNHCMEKGENGRALTWLNLTVIVPGLDKYLQELNQLNANQTELERASIFTHHFLRARAEIHLYDPNLVDAVEREKIRIQCEIIDKEIGNSTPSITEFGLYRNSDRKLRVPMQRLHEDLANAVAGATSTQRHTL